MDGVLIISQFVVLVGSIAQLLRVRKPLSAGRVARTVLQWSLPINVGFCGFVAFLSHFFIADTVAESIGWPKGNPFQTEIAMANLAMAVVGFCCLWWRGLFWRATGIVQGVFLLGAAFVHTREILQRGNFNPGNAGVIYFWDILVPLAHFVLLALAAREDKE